MNKNIVLVLLVILLCAGAVGAFLLGQSHKQAEEVETSFVKVDFALPDIDGNVREISEWSGNGRLINFWATWCAPCRREIPLLKSTQDKYGENNVQVIGIAVDFRDEVEVYAEEAEFNYPILVGQDEAIEAASASGVEFIGLPFTLIVAPGGELLKSYIGEIHEAQIELIVEVFAGLEEGRYDLVAAQAALASL